MDRTEPGARLPRIVVVGGGAGGLELATRLGRRLGARRRQPRAHVVLVDRSATHIWKPLLHEVAAGSMDAHAHQLAYAAQANWNGFEFQQGELLGLDRTARTIRVGAVIDDDGAPVLPERLLDYDWLVLAVGSVTNFFGVPGAAQFALALDTPEQAERFRRRLIAACMRAQAAAARAAQGGRAQVAVAIIGAGATGVELSAELRNTAEVLKAYGLHGLDPRHDIRIHVIEAGARVLPALPARVAEGIVRLLGRLDVDVLTAERVVAVDARSVRTASGKTIASDITVWAAGIVAPSVLSDLDGLRVNRLGQLVVRRTLQTELDADVYALGDCAACPWDGTSFVPPRAQAAHQQASFLADALAARLGGRRTGEFRFRDFGSLVSLGRLSAVGNLMGGLIGANVLIEGIVARIMYTSLYRMHVLALHGFWGMVLDTLGHWLRRQTTPRVKLH